MMYLMKRLMFVLCVWLSVLCLSTGYVRATAPSCDCDLYDPNDPLEVDNYFDCLADDCGGTDVPVSGNVWGLAVAGLVLALVKYGAHRRLALGTIRKYYTIKRIIS